MGACGSVGYDTVTIAAGASLSGALRIQDGCSVTGVITASTWDTADITFEVSVDGSTYVKLLDQAGTEVEAASVTASSAVALNEDTIKGFKYLKVRSGTSAAATNQADATVVTVTYRRVA